MEILSTGEKIKRARIYRGYTLKYICGDKISVSKMSCIENNKVVSENWILEHVAKKLDLDVTYLKDDVKSQIIRNINTIKNKHKKDYEKNLEYNLVYAEEYKYYKEAFLIMHMIFQYNIEKCDYKKLQSIIPKYYILCLKSKYEDNGIVYYKDIARYLYNSGELVQAAAYYNIIRNEAFKKNKNDIVAEAMFNECNCYFELENYDRCYNVCTILIDYVKHFRTDVNKAKLYNILAVLSIINNTEKFEEYKEKAYKLCGNNNFNKGKFLYNYASAMFYIGRKDKAFEYIKEAIEFIKNESKEKFVKFMLMSVKKLLKNNMVEEAEKINSDVINYAIELDNIVYIEKVYHYKAVLLGKKSEFISEEMYMNLSLDSLMKFGDKKHIYERYIEMGNMYYKMNNPSEAVKYFNLAINLHKEI